MGSLTPYHVMMLIDNHQEMAIKDLFQYKNWTIYIKMLSENTISSLIQYTDGDILPFLKRTEETIAGIRSNTGDNPVKISALDINKSIDNDDDNTNICKTSSKATVKETLGKCLGESADNVVADSDDGIHCVSETVDDNDSDSELEADMEETDDYSTDTASEDSTNVHYYSTGNTVEDRENIGEIENSSVVETHNKNTSSDLKEIDYTETEVNQKILNQKKSTADLKSKPLFKEDEKNKNINQILYKLKAFQERKGCQADKIDNDYVKLQRDGNSGNPPIDTSSRDSALKQCLGAPPVAPVNFKNETTNIDKATTVRKTQPFLQKWCKTQSKDLKCLSIKNSNIKGLGEHHTFIPNSGIDEECTKIIDQKECLKDKNNTNRSKIKKEEKKSESSQLLRGIHCTGPTEYQCPHCMNYYVNAKAVRNHVFRVHPEHAPRFMCDICKLDYETRDDLREHRRASGHIGQKPENFQCELCGKCLKRFDSYQKHQERIHRNVYTYPCDQCGRMFKTIECIKAHKKRVHTFDPCTCEICGKTFPHQIGLRFHKRRHDPKKKSHKCDKCGKAFFTSQPLKIHMRTHTGEKPYKCTLCTYACTCKQNLSKHMLVHQKKEQASDKYNSRTDWSCAL